MGGPNNPTRHSSSDLQLAALLWAAAICHQQNKKPRGYAAGLFAFTQA
jgi:hypothetical protein